MTEVTNRSVREVLTEASSFLTDSESPWLDATLLLGEVLGYSREKILASYPDILTEEHYESYRKLIDLRKKGYPVAYLTGIKEFFGRDFFVEEGILCPRPDTEILIEAALEQILQHHYTRVHDLCTGSGCIALTLALEHKYLKVSASDISEISEKVFIRNKENLNAGNIPFKRTSLLKGLTGPLDLIVSNPPYLTTEETETRMEQNWKEPSLALDGGADGLDLVREIVSEAPSLLSAGGMLMMEADPRQMDEMESIMASAGFTDIDRVRDLASHERVIYGRIL